MMSAPRIVKCPQCGQPVEWSPASRWRPFCSERCKTIDLGAWASEAYRIRDVDAPEPDSRPFDRPADRKRPD
jgi:endogenous inhibitor of DNA gyrase (YacG/DUF329 family)